MTSRLASVDTTMGTTTARALLKIADRMDALARRMTESVGWDRAAFDRLDARQVSDDAALVRGAAAMLKHYTAGGATP